jgi:RNA polymerase sigma factor (sigma-70 family)
MVERAPAQQTDRELLAEYVNGSRAAFDQLVDRYATLVYSACLRVLSDGHSAQDAAQAVFVVLMEKAGKLSARENLAGWFYRTALNCARAARKAARRRSHHEKEAAEVKRTETREGASPWSELSPQLDAAMAALPRRQREAVLLRYMCGVSQQEASRELACSPETLHTRARRGLERLRSILARRGIAAPAAALGGLLAANAISPVPPALLVSIKATAAGTAAASSSVTGIAGGAMKAMLWAKIKIVMVAICAATVLGGGGTLVVNRLAAAEPAGPLPEKLKSAPVNSWVKIEKSKTGGRLSPAFVYVPHRDRFVVAGGGVSHGVRVRHYETEELDLASGKWVNAYPKGAPASYAPEAGPTKISAGRGKEHPFKDAAGFLRLPMIWDNFGRTSRVHFSYAYDPTAKRFYLASRGKTLCYDPDTRAWKDTGAAGGTGRWGSMCFDPVNNEILAVGGMTSLPGGDRGTWVYSVAKNRWARLSVGSAGQKELGKKIRAVARECWTLLSACRNRFFMTETTAEARVKLGPKITKLQGGLKQLAAEAKDFKLTAEDLKNAAGFITVLGGKADGKLDPDALLAGQKAFEKVERAVDALGIEPLARANAAMVYDVASRKIVLFGGDGLDRHYGDTWVYDCKTRKWEQRYPKTSPAPRAGSSLVYLPKAKKLLLLGGYALGSRHSYQYHRTTYLHRPFEMWVYDTAGNDWKLLIHLPLAAKGQPGPGAPTGDKYGTWPAAARGDDVVVLFGANGRSRSTWACKVNASKVDAAATAKYGVPPRSVEFRGENTGNKISSDPAWYERGVTPDAAATAAKLKRLPTNTWVWHGPPKQPGDCGWGSTTWDPDRRQLLLWGGGHGHQKGTGVFHYSARTGLWSTSYRPEWPIEEVLGFQVGGITFRGRPNIPLHTYQAYAYDPPSGLMLYGNRAYNVAKREWESENIKLPFAFSPLKTSLETTPQGVIAWTQDRKLFRFEAKSRGWKPLAVKGGDLGKPWADGAGMCYDSKRDCLWLAPEGRFLRYDIKTGVLTKLPPRGKWALWREQVYLPESDLILLMRLFKAPDGKSKNIAYDPETGKWHWLELAFVKQGKRLEKSPAFSWDDAMLYNRHDKVAYINDISTRSANSSIWMLRLDRKTAKLEEIK